MPPEQQDVSPPAVPLWLRAVTIEDLVGLAGAMAVAKGRDYQRRGTVRTVSVGSRTLSATVHGTRLYRSTVTAPTRQGAGAGGGDLTLDCTCPVRFNCKHAVALVLHAQAAGKEPTGRGGLTVAPAPGSAWEDRLAPVLSEVQPVPVHPAASPLALHVEARVTSTTGHQRRLALRPLVRGASGAWIKTGIGWSDLQHNFGTQHLHPVHRAALAAVVKAHRAVSFHWGAQPDWIWADTLGPGLWSLLRDAQDAGVVLVTGPRGNRPVRLIPERVGVALDLTRDADGQITLRPLVDLPRAAGTPVLLGTPAHGVRAEAEGQLVLAELTNPLSAAVTAVLGSDDALTIPGADLDHFLRRYYPALTQQATVSSSDGSVELPHVVPPWLGLEVRFKPGHRTQLRWGFRYAVGSRVHTVPLLRGQPGDRDDLVRDATREEELLASLEVLDRAEGLLEDRPGHHRPGVIMEPELSGWATVHFVREVLPVLQERDDIDVVVAGEMLTYQEADEAPLVAVSTHDLAEEDEADEEGGEDKEGEAAERGERVDRATGATRVVPDGPQDWFDLRIRVTIQGRRVPLAALLAALTRGDDRMLLDDGMWFSLDVPELDALRELVDEARALQDIAPASPSGSDPDSALQISRYQVGLWEDLVALGTVAEQSQRWQRTVGDLLTLKELPHPAPPAGLTATLRGYQLEGYHWLSFLWEHELGGILADDMGLGKTVQVLAAAERAREEGRVSPERPLLVVAPTSVVPTWLQEAARFTPELRVQAVTQTVARAGVPLAETIAGADVVVTSYALLRIDAEDFTAREWSAVVLDEAQAVKNRRSRSYQVARSLRAPSTFAITGTPLENSLMDLWSLLSLAAPGLFPNPRNFAAYFRKPIESGNAPDLLATLRRRVRPLMLRRTKEAVAPDLPPKIEQVVTVPLNAAHRRLYDTHLQRERQRILGLLADVKRNRIAILAALTKLRQLSLDPHLVLPDTPDTVRSSKVDALLDRLTEVVAEGHRCLVFSQFTRFLHVVRDRLDAADVGHVYLDGHTRDRGRRIAQFTDGQDPVFLISLKAGGSGLTLTEADYVFVLDPWWNPAVEAQAVDRTHRIGQDRTVMVYRLVAKDTIEEKVVALQERKRDLFTQVVDEDGLLGAPLTADDIRGLLGG